jgi:hypothetical protein
MEIETLDTKFILPSDNRFLNSSLLTFDLPTLISNMKHSYSWLKGEINTMILLKSPGVYTIQLCPKQWKTILS